MFACYCHVLTWNDGLKDIGDIVNVILYVNTATFYYCNIFHLAWSISTLLVI